ncbi:MAG TPA: NADPH-dependent 7-cyano-7-deazaguanine reductase QueF, partial [Gammaproteobacteria bacterium]|nr:NADPH-dependent 7-cyano-7-deazaguanine reductase QueF [Gammaproteobacteria bacterium]
MVIKQREGHKDLTLDLDKLPLGKKITYPEKYDPSLLVGISREESRSRSAITLEPNTFYGLDSWTAYELSWLNLEGIPKNAVLYASYESNSKKFIESKSFKLYLNSLNNKIFNSLDDLLALIKHDLEQCVSSEVEIEIKNTPKDFVKESKSIDLVEINSEEGVVEDAPWVSADEVSEEISCSVFRSLCPVTSQPDWATIRVTYSGKLINYQKLLSYLLSFRNSQAFHEECVEKIFSDLKKFCAPNELTVRANFLRR